MVKIALVMILYAVFATLASREYGAPHRSVGNSSGGSQANDVRIQ